MWELTQNGRSPHFQLTDPATGRSIGVRQSKLEGDKSKRSWNLAGDGEVVSRNGRALF